MKILDRLLKLLGRKPQEPAETHQLIETIRVPRREPYMEDPDEEGECGDAMPLEDMEGLFDPDKAPQDKQTLVDILQKQGFNIKRQTR